MDELTTLAKRLEETKHRKVYAYLRVSSDMQRREGESLEAQEEAVKKYCEAHDLDEPVIVKEAASAGKRLFGMPKLKAVQEDAAEEEKEREDARPRFLLLLGHVTQISNAHLVVWKLDRFSRYADELEMLYQLLRRHETTLHSTMPHEASALNGDDPSDPMASLIRQIFGAFAQYERATIEMRMTSGLRFKAARGGYTGGRPPYGYDVGNSDLMINEYRAKIVRYVFMLRVYYAWTLSAIASHMSDALGEKWSKMRVHRICKNEQFYFGRYKDRFGDIHEREDLKILYRPDHNYTEEFRNDQGRGSRDAGDSAEPTAAGRVESEHADDGPGEGPGPLREGQGVADPGSVEVAPRERGGTPDRGGGGDPGGGGTSEGVPDAEVPRGGGPGRGG